MRTRIKKAVVGFFSVTLLLVGPGVVRALAYECATISEYADMWDDSEEANAVLGLYGRAIADGGGDPCSVTVRGYIKGPSGNELTNSYGYGSGYAETTIVTYLDPNSVEEGEYHTGSEAWSMGIHYGCALSPISTILASIARYQLVKVVGNGRVVYSRCDTGPCLLLTLLVSNDVPPPFALVLVIHIGYDYNPSTCFGGFGTAVASC